jgi:hypothetical protein
MGFIQNFDFGDITHRTSNFVLYVVSTTGIVRSIRTYVTSPASLMSSHSTQGRKHTFV